MGARMVIAVNLSGDTMGGVPMTERRHRNGDGGQAFYDGPERRRADETNLGPAVRRLLSTDQEEPNFFGTMSSSFAILLDRITRSRLAGDPPDVSVSPRVGHIGLFDFHRADEAIEEGAKAIDRIVPVLIEVMGVFGMGIQRDMPESAARSA
jgi:NTE family protein